MLLDGAAKRDVVAVFLLIEGVVVQSVAPVASVPSSLKVVVVRSRSGPSWL